MSGTYILRGDQKYQFIKTKVFNIDNGSGTADNDVVLSNLPYDIYIEDIKAVYTEATDTSGAASSNFKVGTTAGGTEITAATPLAVSKAVGSTTTATLVARRVPAGGMVYVRHTGIAATEAGQYFVQIAYRILA